MADKRSLLIFSYLKNARHIEKICLRFFKRLKIKILHFFAHWLCLMWILRIKEPKNKIG